MEYYIDIIQVGGVGSRLITKTAWVSGEHGPIYLHRKGYIKVSFNRGGDVMWLFPPKDFRITQCTSPTKNTLELLKTHDGCNILLEDKLKNEILATLNKQSKPNSQ